MVDTVRDAIRVTHGQIVRARSYPHRNAVLEENKRLQAADNIPKTDGLRAAARFPAHELERIAAANPSRWGDLVAPDAQIRSRAINKLINSSEGREYRVGGTRSKSFFFKHNPLAKG